MKIIIIGCGKIGTTILDSLLAEGHDITVLDTNPEVMKEINNIYDVIAYCGSGTDCDDLGEVNVSEADLVVAVTGSDEFNMLSCFLAKKLGAKYTMARIRNPEYNAKNLDFLKRELNISLAINPELLVARELSHILKLPTAVTVETFSRGSFEMVEILLRDDTPIVGMNLIELKKKYPENFLICAVQRGEDVIIPDGNFILQSGDIIGITAVPSQIQRLLKKLKLDTRKARDVMILGATTTAFYLARLLLADGNSVKIIDNDRARCLEFSEQLPEAVIINGDAAHRETLLEENVNNVDAFVALTGNDEANILIAYSASQLGAPKVISKINRKGFISTAKKLGIDCIASPSATIANVAVRYARALENSMGSRIETLYKLMNGKAEALEFEVAHDCELINIPLRQLPNKRNTLIAGIIRGHKTIIPTGEDMIKSGDRVVVLCTGYKFNDLEDLVER